jgi:hypothetical protein
LVSGATYTASIWIKAAGRTLGTLTVLASGEAGAGFIGAQFNLDPSSPTITSSGQIQAFQDGWYRISVTGTSSITGSAQIFLYFQQGAYLGVEGLGFDIDGAQLEAGSFPTSYIPTTTGSVVRSADVCSITGSAFTGFWNRFAGTCIIGVGSALGSTPAVISNLLSARTLEIYTNSSFADFFEASGAQVVRIANGITYPTKIGLAYAINDYQSSVAGVLGGSDTNTGGTIPDATQLHIGNLGGTSNRLTGHIQSIRYYKKRLPDAKLVTLTT